MIETTLVVIVVLGIAVIVFMINNWFKNLPKWTKVKFYIVDQTSFGMSLSSIEQGLMDKFKLTENEARLCVNNYQDDEWLQLQSFLED